MTPTAPGASAPPLALTADLDETWGPRWRRRAVTFSSVALLWLLTVSTLPVLMAVAAVWDVVTRSRWAALRFVGVLLIFLTAEVVGLWLAFGIWVGLVFGRDHVRFVERNFRLQGWWVAFIFNGSRRLLGARVEVDGADVAAAGPLFMFIRHASLIDTLLPAHLVSSRFGLRLRYVLKRDLVWDPCLDVVGHRLDNAFVQRGGTDTANDVAAVRALVARLTERDGVLLFPEGTRFSGARRTRSLAAIEARAPELLERAERLENVLPPRLGGVLTLIEANPDVDVVFCSHRGLDGVRRFGDILRGGLVGRTIAVKFWRCAAATIPRERDARIAWLYDQWMRVDGFVGAGSVLRRRTSWES